MNLPSDLTGKVLRRLYEKGVDPTQIYDIEFVHVFSDQTAAEAMAEEVRSSGAEAAVEFNESESKWDCRIVLQMLPTYENVSRAEQDLDRLARAHGGRSDGWGMLH